MNSRLKITVVVIYVHEENVEHFQAYANHLGVTINWNTCKGEISGPYDSRC